MTYKYITKKIRVVKEEEYEIRIRKDLLTDDNLNFIAKEIDEDSLSQNEVFDYVVSNINSHEYCSSLLGLGKVECVNVMGVPLNECWQRQGSAVEYALTWESEQTSIPDEGYSRSTQHGKKEK